MILIPLKSYFNQTPKLCATFGESVSSYITRHVKIKENYLRQE